MIGRSLPTNNLIEGDLLGLFVLDVADSTICENMPLDLEFAEDFLSLRQDFDDDEELPRASDRRRAWT